MNECPVCGRSTLTEKIGHAIGLGLGVALLLLVLSVWAWFLVWVLS